MATIFLVDWHDANMNDRAKRYAEMSLERWGERQGGAAFVSVDSTFILTDYAYEHKEVGLLRHLLNCNHISYRAIANVDLSNLGESVYARAVIGKINNNNKPQKKGA